MGEPHSKAPPCALRRVARAVSRFPVSIELRPKFRGALRDSTRGGIPRERDALDPRKGAQGFDTAGIAGPK